MFFSCTSCRTRLQLPDEQVVNRILKIRCTACGTVMTVKDGITGKHQRPGEATWFVAVGGEQKGPMSVTEVRALIDERRIDQRSYVWTAGMDKWARAGEVQALAGLFVTTPPPLPVLGALDEAAPREAAPSQTAGGGLEESASAGGDAALGAGERDARSEAEALAAALHEAAEQAAREAERRIARDVEAEAPPAEAAASEPAAAAEAMMAPGAQVARRDVFDLSGLEVVDEPAATSRGRSPDELRAEMMALNQEFSVVARLEGSKKKRWIWLGAGVLAAGAVVAILASGPAKNEPLVADVTPSKHKPYEEVERRVAQPRIEAVPVVAERAAGVEGATGAEADAVGGAQDDASEGDVTPAGEPDAALAAGKPSRRVGLVVPPPQPKVKELTAERLAALTQDEVGKRETRVVFDPGEASRKAAEEAAAKKAAATADALGEEVAAVFGKKKTQFAKCSDDTPERVRVEFTVTPTGKTVDAKVDGTASDNKARCLKAILDRSIFPAGDVELTYRQTLVL